jgi:hypothetical protein
MNVGRIRNGAILLSAGVVLLLNTTNYIDWSVWLKILSLWPVALIAIGIELLFKKSRLAFIALLSPLLFFATILGPAFFYKADYVDFGRASRTFHFDRDMDSTYAELSTSIRLNSGNLYVSSGEGMLVSAELDYYSKEPVTTFKQDDQTKSVSLEITDQEKRWLSGKYSQRWFYRVSGRKNWDIGLTDLIPVSLNLYMRGGEADLNFSELKLRECELEAKDSDVEIKIGSQLEEVTAKIESRSSKFSISIPEGTGLKIVNRTNLSSTSFSWLTLEEKEDGYQTPDFEEAPRKLTLYLEGSLTRLNIRKYEPFEGI